MLLFLLACAAETPDIALCPPSARFAAPEPDFIVLDDDRRILVQVVGACLSPSDLYVTWERPGIGASGSTELICDAGASFSCEAHLPTDLVEACSGEGTWSILRLKWAEGADTGEPTLVELDEVGIPFAVAVTP